MLLLREPLPGRPPLSPKAALGSRFLFSPRLRVWSKPDGRRFVVTMANGLD
jgi:hypothetical protein